MIHSRLHQGGGGSAELRHTDGHSQVEHDGSASSVEPARAGQDGVVFVGGIVNQGVVPDMLEKVRRPGRILKTTMRPCMSCVRAP